MASVKTTKKKQNATGRAAVSDTALPVTGSKARAKGPAKSAALRESVGENASLKVARTVQMTSVAAASNNPAGEQSILAPVKAMAAAAGVAPLETSPSAVGVTPHSIEPLSEPVAVTHSLSDGLSQPPSQEEISRRAYFYWAERGFQHGFADEDWARAEAELTR